MMAVPTRAAVILPWDRGERDHARSAEHRLAEAVGLTASIGLVVVHTAILPLRIRRPSTLLGEGQVSLQGRAIAEHDVEVVVVDAALSPVQQRNLERAWNCKVIDRTGLILDIFGERAATREGSLQVELAHLDYQRSRLVRSWTHLERQRGGFGFLGGPGETQIEADRRLIGDRIVRLKKELRAGAAHPRPASLRPPPRAVPGGRAGRLHQRGQVHAVQRADRRRGDRARPAVRDARSDHARAAAAVRAARHPVRHRRFHQRTAARTGRSVSRHAGRSGGGRRDPARARRRPSGQRRAARRRGGGAGGHGDGRRAGRGLAVAHDRGDEQSRSDGRRCIRAGPPRCGSRSPPSPARAWRR